MNQLTINFPDAAWQAAFIAWMQRTGADDFVESKEADPLYGTFDKAELTVEATGGVLTVEKDAYDA